MGILIISILLLLIGIGILIFSYDLGEILGACLLGIGGLMMMFIIIVLLIKPIFYTEFKAKYETIKEIQTSSEDIRDAAYTNKIIEINTEIRVNRKHVSSFWNGILYSKKIAEMELLDK